jgi:hypothetical protein
MMNIFARLRERIGAVIGAVVGSIALLGCGLLFTLFLAPQQKLEARRIEKIPEMDVKVVNSLSSGEDVLFTGRLRDNPTILENYDFVAYQMETWDVTIPQNDPDESDQEPSGNWDLVEQRFPELMIEMDGETIQTLNAERVTMSGPLHEVLLPSPSGTRAKYNGDWLNKGSQRYRGFYDGDLITVLGQKAASGGVVPNEYYAGDRVSFVESKHEAAKIMLIAGISMIVCSPIALVGGVLTAAFGRRRR